MSKDAYYFPHDSNARHDPKIMAMLSVYGAKGYGWYWMIIEILREQPDYKLEINEFTYRILASSLNLQPTSLKRFLEDCEKRFTDKGNPLLHNNGFIYSDSLISRMALYQARSEAAREKANKRWAKDRDYSNQKYGNIIQQ